MGNPTLVCSDVSCPGVGQNPSLVLDSHSGDMTRFGVRYFVERYGVRVK